MEGINETTSSDMTSSVLHDVITTAVSYVFGDVTTESGTESPFYPVTTIIQDNNYYHHPGTNASGNSFSIINDLLYNDTEGMYGSYLNNITSGNSSNNNNNTTPGNFTRRRPSRDIGMDVQIPIYIIIFLLSVVGNILVIVTVVQNKKMRSVTNVFLLNLALSDLLLSVFCMPFTLVPIFLKNFIFGEVMCVVIRYMQGVSVAVSCFTLVSISLERYFAICHPLKSRRWQTMSHSYKAIAICWILALSLMMPLAIYHDLVQIGPSRHMCVEIWPSHDELKAYTVALNLLMLVLPIIIMTWAYGRVSYTLWLGMRMEDKHNKESGANYNSSNGVSIFIKDKTSSRSNDDMKTVSSALSNSSSHNSSISFVATNKTASVSRPFRRIDAHRAMRQSNSEKSRAAKKRVIKMLFIIVLEFFIFWTPVYIVYTWMTFDLDHARQHIPPKFKSLIHLLSYISACSNPITYCFMNKNFRHSFLLAFRCRERRHVYSKSQMSFTGNSISTRATQSRATSYDMIGDSDDISENGL